MNFDQWIYIVCENISLKSRKEITDVYSSIDLTDAKLAFIDNETPQQYIASLWK